MIRIMEPTAKYPVGTFACTTRTVSGRRVREAGPRLRHPYLAGLRRAVAGMAAVTRLTKSGDHWVLPVAGQPVAQLCITPSPCASRTTSWSGSSNPSSSRMRAARSGSWFLKAMPIGWRRPSHWLGPRSRMERRSTTITLSSPLPREDGFRCRRPRTMNRGSRRPRGLADRLGAGRRAIGLAAWRLTSAAAGENL